MWDVLQELSERKKMLFSNPIPQLDYRACTLTQGKIWYISFYVKNPDTRKLQRIRIKINNIKLLSERRRTAKVMMAEINRKLSLGWNPILEKFSEKAYHKLFGALDSFIRHKGKDAEENTMRSYRSFIKTFKAWLIEHGFDGDSYANSVSDAVAREFMNDVELETSAKTYNNYITFYRCLYAWLIEQGYVCENPFASIAKKPKRLIKKTRRILNDDELGKLISYLSARNPQYLAIAMICYGCFVRPKEIALLRCRDIDLSKQLLHITAEVAKNDNDSYRTIPDELAKILRNLDLSHPDYYVFGQHKESDNFNPGPLKICSRKIAKWWDMNVRPDCGFGQELKFYSLKDTGITNMLGDGVPINLVQRQADHSSVAMTAIYVGNKPSATSELKNFELASPRK